MNLNDLLNQKINNTVYCIRTRFEYNSYYYVRVVRVQIVSQTLIYPAQRVCHASTAYGGVCLLHYRSAVISWSNNILLVKKVNFVPKLSHSVAN